MVSASFILLLSAVVGLNVVTANPYGYRGYNNAPVPYGSPPFVPPQGYGPPIPIVIDDDDSSLEKILPLLLIMLTRC